MTLRRLAIVSVAIALAAVAIRVRASVERPLPSSEWRMPPDSPVPAAERRATEQTFLTFPEWYLVYSPDELAKQMAGGRPSSLPYLEHIGQFWQGYRFVYNATKNDYPFNSEYHVMIGVIGTSTTVEYGIKWLYESTIGRVAEITRLHGLTAEDRLAADVAREYVAFLDVEPWYRFNFMGALRRLWSDTGWWGPDPLRKYERKWFLTTEYASKALYGYLLGKASESSYGIESTVTPVVLDRQPNGLESPNLRVRQQLPEGRVLIDLPRYQAFTAATERLAAAGINFVDIAGNRGPILITAIVNETVTNADLIPLMTQPIVSRPGYRRIAFTVNVPDLTRVVAALRARGVVIEHIYDY